MAAIAIAENYNKSYLAKKTMKTIPEKFESIKLGDIEKNSCIPEIDEWDFRGIEISSPSRVAVNEEFVFPLCGIWQFSYAFINKFKQVDKEIVIVIIDMETFESYSGNLQRPGSKSEDYRKSVGTDEELEMNTASGWFTIDVYDYVRSLPEKAGRYSIYTIVGDVKSNVVEVVIEVEKGTEPGPRKPRPQ